MWMGLVKNVRSQGRSYMQPVSRPSPNREQAASQRCKDSCRPVVRGGEHAKWVAAGGGQVLGFDMATHMPWFALR
jgi:hypothetical protein